MGVRELREALDMSQTELALRLGLRQASVHAWEIGKAYPSAENLIKLSKIFNCTTDKILGLENEDQGIE